MKFVILISFLAIQCLIPLTTSQDDFQVAVPYEYNSAPTAPVNVDPTGPIEDNIITTDLTTERPPPPGTDNCIVFDEADCLKPCPPSENNLCVNERDSICVCQERCMPDTSVPPCAITCEEKPDCTTNVNFATCSCEYNCNTTTRGPKRLKCKPVV